MIKTEILKTKCKIKLPDTLDANASEELKTALLSAISEYKPLEIDASAVSRLDTLCSQILLAASRTLNTAGQSFSITKQSDMFVDTLTLLDMKKELLKGENA